MPIEEPAKKKKATKKENKAKRAIPKPKPPIMAVPPVESVKPATESKKAKPESAGKQSDPEDIYATLDWDTNPPINGFYETMMSLTPERRKALRLEAERHRPITAHRKCTCVKGRWWLTGHAVPSAT